MKLKKTTYFDPYIKDSHGNDRATLSLSWTGSESGIYFIRNKRTKEIVYIGSSRSQLKKTIYRHFQTWSSRGEQRFDRTIFSKYGHYEVRIILCDYDRALTAEKYLVYKWRPKGNPLKYSQLSLYQFKKGQEIEKEIATAETITKKEIYAF